MRQSIGLLTAFLLAISVGCQHIDLERRTLEQTSTLTTIYYVEVLQNIAMFAVNSESLPFFGAPGTGEVTNQRNGEFDPTLGWDFFSTAGRPTVFILDKISSAGKWSRTSTGKWTVATTWNPDALYLMRSVYQRVVGRIDPEQNAQLEKFFKNRPEYLDAMHPGWFGIGHRGDVPHQACFVGRYGDTYAWVCPRGARDLSFVTLAILDLASFKPETTPLSPPPPLGNKVQLMMSQQKAELLQHELMNATSDDQKRSIQHDLESTNNKINELLNEGVPAEQPTNEPFFRPRENLSLPPGGPGVLPIPQ